VAHEPKQSWPRLYSVHALTHGHAVVGESCPILVVLEHFFFRPDQVFDKIDGQGGNDHVEVLQVRVLVSISPTFYVQLLRL